MAISVSICTMNGTLLGPMSFPGPSVKVAELRACVQQAQANQIFDLLLEDRLLNDSEELVDPELLVTAAFDTDYAAIKVQEFDELGLNENLLRGIRSYGFERPAALQQCAIRPLIDGRDVFAMSQSGTGKTATYVIGSLQRMDCNMPSTQILVLAPTRELACPIQKVAIALGDYLRLTSHACVNRTLENATKLREKPHFVVGTPGILGEMVSKQVLSLDALKMFILDEVDEMMSRGFKGLIYDTMEILPPEVQLSVFSATMPADVLEAIKRFLKKPVRLTIKKEDLALEGVRQFYVAIEKEEWKLDTLIDLMDTLALKQLVIYCNTRRKVEFLASKLGSYGIDVFTIHADLDQNERELIMSKFVPGARGILISTDMLARGLDVQVFPAVVNFDLPQNMENYLHRIGRSDKFGMRGVAINFVTNNDVRTMKDIEKYYHTQIEECPIDIADMLPGSPA